MTSILLRWEVVKKILRWKKSNFCYETVAIIILLKRQQQEEKN